MPYQSEYTGAEVDASVAATQANGGRTQTSGSGSPEGVVTAPPGSLYTDEDTGDLYVKKTGTGNTGWV